MGATAIALTAFKVAVRGRGTVLTGPQLIRIHGQTHRTARFTPVHTSINKYLIQTLSFRLRLNHL